MLNIFWYVLSTCTTLQPSSCCCWTSTWMLNEKWICMYWGRLKTAVATPLLKIWTVNFLYGAKTLQPNWVIYKRGPALQIKTNDKMNVGNFSDTLWFVDRCVWSWIMQCHRLIGACKTVKLGMIMYHCKNTLILLKWH